MVQVMDAKFKAQGVRLARMPVGKGGASSNHAWRGVVDTGTNRERDDAPLLRYQYV